MKNILYLTDFIEGKSVVASVRYEGLLPHLLQNYNFIVVNNKAYGDKASKFCKENYKFNTIRSSYSKDWTLVKDEKISYIEKFLRRCSFVMNLWKSICHSEILFNIRNRNLYKQLIEYVNTNRIDAIFATVPDTYTLYIAKYIKKYFKDTPLIVEVRDIISYRYAKRKAESILGRYADGVITLTKEIYNYYNKIYLGSNITEIKNGYNDEDFENEYYKKINLSQKKKLAISHIGSVYSGRNINDFIKALIIVSKKLSVDITFNIVGFLDAEALEDIKKLDDILDKSRVKINITGTLKHKKAVKYLNDTDIAAILTQKKSSYYAIPGKTFEYIGSCTPIIAVTEDKPLIELIDGLYGECAKHNENDIAEKLLKIINSKYDFSDRNKFSRKVQAENITNFINKTIERNNIELNAQCP